MNSIHGIFDRTERLIGREGMQAMASVRVVLFGVGGVGSWCAEGLVRSGIQHLTIVDSDVVCASNINRQLMATTQTIGRPKVDVLKKRLLEISPDAEIDARHEIFCEATASSFHLDDYDYIVDAIDSVADKALLINMATRTKAVLFSSMGAALKMDPTRISVAEFWKVEGCPLARALRKRFKKEGTIPKKKFQCVYSNELLENQPTAATDDSGNGSLVHITGIFGFTLAGLIVKHIHTSVKTTICAPSNRFSPEG